MVLLLILAIGWVVRKIYGPEATKIAWLKVKWLVAYLYLILVKRLLKPDFPFDEKSKNLGKSGVTSLPEAWKKENPRKLLDVKQAIDSINIWGADESGNALMVRVARRHGRVAELWIYLKLATGEEYQSPVQPDLRICNTDGKSFSVKGFQFEVLEPLRRWRIGFNGILRKGVKSQWDNQEDDNSVAVEFNLIWHPMYSCSSYPLDFNTKLTATKLSKCQWDKDFFLNRKLTSTKWHEQWGQMQGYLVTEQKKLNLLLTGTKTREFGVLDWKTINKKLTIRGFDSIGTAIDLFAEEDANGQLNVYHGVVSPPSNKELYFVSKCDIGDADVAYFGGNGGKLVEMDLIADDRKFHVKLGTEGSKFQFFAGEDWDCQGCCRLIELEINGKQGFGLIESYKNYGQGSPLVSPQSVIQLIEPDFTTNDLIVTFEDRACMNSKLVGGKGASLALMTLLNKQDDRFAVPPGFCLTKTCFEQHLKDNLSLELAIYRLQDVAWKRKDGDLELECGRLTDLICNSSLSKNLKIELATTLKKTFGEDFENIQFAVRSSAIGEDGEEMSAAGQNETFLGINGLEMISNAVLKCWASQFSFRSVEYKRQNGQLINGGMAVVIQEMIAADVAGVLFSRDPLTGNPKNMVISSNYGLGESVVSATVDPDTIILDRSWSDKLSIAEVTVGKKETKQVLKDGGTLETEVDAMEASKCSVSDVIALQLAKMAIELERHFGSSRDIEWALQNGNIYLLQARPITSGLAIKDCEVMHEFDIAMRTPHEQFTTANVAEVVPGALSPLHITSCFRVVSQTCERIMARKSKRFISDSTVLNGMPIYTNHALLDEIWGQVPYLNSQEKGIMAKVSELGMYGRVLDNNSALQKANERYEKQSTTDMLSLMSIAFQGMFNSNGIVKSCEDKYQKFNTPASGISTAHEAYLEIGKYLTTEIISAFKNHMKVTFGSILWNGFTLTLLAKGAGDINLDVYTDFASLIGRNNGAESGEVPNRLKKIAATISEEDVDKTFVSLPPKEALHWMNTKLNKSSSQFQEFLQRHGHRGLKEIDVMSITWGMEPTKVVKMLQTMLQHPPNSETNRENPLIEETIKKLKISLTPLKRKLLKWLVSRSINGICYRERAKSILTKAIHGLRLSYHHLAGLMIREGFIPEKELLFFMTFEEIGELMETRSARIIRRARRRRLLYPVMDSIVYPERIEGLPTPIYESNEEARFVQATQVKGYPVCHGRVKGTARVIVTLDEVDTLKRNDILITHATDIGWSPYFPMLSGVVTEIGGLVSHGAVVAREYGLPCIIDAAHATKIFKSGDEVLLDATNGFIAKLSGDLKSKGDLS